MPEETDLLAGKERARLGPADNGEAARLVEVGSNLGQELVVAEADRDGDRDLFLDLARQRRERRSRAGAVQGPGAGEVHERLVDGERLHEGREVQHHRPDPAAVGGVFLHVGLDDGCFGTEPERLGHRHRGAHAMGAGDVAACRNHAPVVAADDHGDVCQLGPVALLDRGVEGVAVEMGDGEIVEFRVAQDAHRPAGRACPGVRWRPAATVAAECVHERIIEPPDGPAAVENRMAKGRPRRAGDSLLADRLEP